MNYIHSSAMKVAVIVSITHVNSKIDLARVQYKTKWNEVMMSVCHTSCTARRLAYSIYMQQRRLLNYGTIAAKVWTAYDVRWFPSQKRIVSSKLHAEISKISRVKISFAKKFEDCNSLNVIMHNTPWFNLKNSN